MISPVAAWQRAKDGSSGRWRYARTVDCRESRDRRALFQEQLKKCLNSLNLHPRGVSSVYPSLCETDQYGWNYAPEGSQRMVSANGASDLELREACVVRRPVGACGRDPAATEHPGSVAALVRRRIRWAAALPATFKLSHN